MPSRIGIRTVEFDLDLVGGLRRNRRVVRRRDWGGRGQKQRSETSQIGREAERILGMQASTTPRGNCMLRCESVGDYYADRPLGTPQSGTNSIATRSMVTRFGTWIIIGTACGFNGEPVLRNGAWI